MAERGRKIAESEARTKHGVCLKGAHACACQRACTVVGNSGAAMGGGRRKSSVQKSLTMGVTQMIPERPVRDGSCRLRSV